MVRRTRSRLARIACAWAGAAGLACEGSGEGGGGLVVRDEVLDPRCTPVAGSLPSGLALVPGGEGDRAALIQFQPPALVAFDLDPERPRTLGAVPIPPDSDGDGTGDSQRSQSLGFLPFSALMGEVSIPDPRLALISASNYEEVLFADPSIPALRTAAVENPDDAPGFRPEDYPFLPPGGTSAPRTAVSTRACIYPGAGASDSDGVAIATDARCDASEPASFFSNLTAGKAVAAGRLFVATSNLRNSGQARFYPGTVLVYDFDESGGVLAVRPRADVPVLFTSAFNPTGVVRHVTRAGRELVLVTNSGAIGSGTGDANVHTEASVDVIDAAALRIAATIPLGFAGPSFDELAIDPSGRVGVLGASSRRELYAIDLLPLEDARLYQGGPPVLLDGLSAGFPDARIFDADHPLPLPDRADGPAPAECTGFTHAAVSAGGSELYASDYCDGTLTRLRLDLSGAPPVPVPRDRFSLFEQDEPFAPLSDASLGLLRGPSLLRVRPGIPGADYTGPDLFVAVGLPDAQLCGVRAAPR